MAERHPNHITFIELFRLPWATYDFAFKKRLLIEMRWLNVWPEEKFLRMMEALNLKINSQILEQVCQYLIYSVTTNIF